MRILFLSDLYSTPLAPKRGVANARILHAMRAHADIRVMSPVPWYPSMLTRRVPSIRALARLPSREADDDGSTVLHPRRLHVPRMFALQAMLYATSMFAPLRREVARFAPHVLMSAWAFPDATAAVALARMLRLPVVVRVMGSDINDYAQQPLRRPQIALAMRHADRVIAVSRGLAGELRALGVSDERIAIIPTGVDPTHFHAVDRAAARAELGLDDRPLIVVPSRLSREKGVTHFIDALSRIAPNVQAALVGDGPEEMALRTQIERLGLAGRVHFAGFVPQARMRHFYSAADLVCLPSLEEGWPNVLMESFACGCPVVASDVGGVSDIIALTDGGMTAPPGDAAALAGAVEAALERSWDREETARRIGQHSLASTAERYCAACAEVSNS